MAELNTLPYPAEHDGMFTNDIARPDGLKTDGVSLALAGMPLPAVNGALIQIIKGARIFYGMSCNGWLPVFFGVVNPRTRTPLRSTLVAGGIVLALALVLPLVSLAKATSAMVLMVFTLVNLALIRIKRRGPAPEGASWCRAA